MSSSTNEDRQQSDTTTMEDSNLNTIEFLRARLLSERSISKTARQRADELAKRVAELEEQLKFVSVQRRKAEKATVDVLAILENHGISDVSEEFDSCSEQGDTSHNGSLMSKETSNNVKLRKNEKDSYSSSEVESSPSTGRSLSWRSTKDSQHSLEKKKYTDSVKRRASFSSNSSSARRVGKSCRRIRRRDTRSMDESRNDGTENTAYSRDASNCSDGEPVALAETSRYVNGGGTTSVPVKKVNGRSFGVHEKDEDMESALQHQAQLIGQFEEEEKAQREWEEKFRDNNGGTQDSCDPGNHSDITEERYEAKSHELSCAVGITDSDKMMQGPVDACLDEEPQTSKILTPVANADNRHLQDDKRGSAMNVDESPASEFSFPMSGKSDHEFSRKQHEGLTYGKIPPSNVANSPSFSASSGSPSSFKLAVVPQETPNSLGSVLEALQQAKLSLNQKLSSSPRFEGGAPGTVVNPSYAEPNKADSFQFPYTTPGLFRLPTDYHFEATTSANPGSGLQPSFTNYPPEISTRRILSEPYVESRSGFSGDPFLSVPNRPFNQEMRLGASPQRSLSLTQPPFIGTSHLDLYRNPLVPPVQDSYPFHPDVTLGLPLKEEGPSRTFPISERGLPPNMRLTSYAGRGGPNTYR